MGCFSCVRSLATLWRGAAKHAAARCRTLGLAAVAPHWAARAAICERCPLRVVRRGVSYCGTPLLDKLDRDPVIDGCGCPTRDKARAPGEHCPVNVHHRAARIASQRDCDCKWCRLTAALPSQRGAPRMPAHTVTSNEPGR
jgi:hypothetical protein